MLSYVHPVLGALVLALLGYVASLAARSRSDRRNSARFRALHGRLAPWVAGAVLFTGTLGVLTTWLLRPKLHLGESGHFRVAVALTLLVGASTLSSRYIDRDVVRAIHPWFGVASLLVAVAVVFFGLQITP